jgi:hypothetical protein
VSLLFNLKTIAAGKRQKILAHIPTMNRNDKDCVEVTPMSAPVIIPTVADHVEKITHSKRRADVRKDNALLKEITQTSGKCLDELAVRLSVALDALEVTVDTLRQQYEFTVAEIKSLRLAVERNTAAYATLVEYARERNTRELEQNHEQRHQQQSNQLGRGEGPEPTRTAETVSGLTCDAQIGERRAGVTE